MGAETTYHRRRLAFIGVLALGMTAVWLARRRPFRAVVEGSSMEPELREGDLVVAFAGRRPRTGDVVVVERPGDPGFELVKRIVGSPGEFVHLLADGSRLPEPVLLREGQWFVVGDSRTASTDSREFGPVGPEHLRGVVVAVLGPDRRWVRPRR